MKNVLVIFLMSIIYTVSPAHAASKCKVDSYASVFLENGRIYTDITITDGKFVSDANSWEECYEFAIMKAKALPKTLHLVATQRSGSRQETEALVYFKWEFSSVFINPTGKLTSFTNEFVKKPVKGDLRLKEDGSRFE